MASTNGSFNPESQLSQKTYVAGDLTQQWRIINTGSHYGLISRASLQAVDNFGSLTFDNNQITQFFEDIYNRPNQFYSIATASSNFTEPQTPDTSFVRFSLSPNPATGSSIAVQLHLAADADVKMSIYNTQGLLIRQVSKGKLLKGETNFSLPVAGLRTGNYTVTVMANGRNASQLLLMK